MGEAILTNSKWEDNWTNEKLHMKQQQQQNTQNFKDT